MLRYAATFIGAPPASRRHPTVTARLLNDDTVTLHVVLFGVFGRLSEP